MGVRFADNIRGRLSFGKAGILAPVLLVLIECAHKYQIGSPDMDRFYRTVASPALRDSLRQSKLVAGMPYFAVSQIFSNWPAKHKKVPVASIGSRQRLREREGWGRSFDDPYLQVFMDEYKTDKGKLNIWYQYPDFYRMGVSDSDTLLVFWKEDSVSYVVIECLRDPLNLHVREGLAHLPDDTAFYCEIRHVDHPRRKVSYWYGLSPWSDKRKFSCEVSGFEDYPIEWMELDGDTVASFSWK